MVKSSLYRTLDVEQIGSVYETVMGFTVETRPGLTLAIRAGKNDRTRVLRSWRCLRRKGAEGAKVLKEVAYSHVLADRSVNRCPRRWGIRPGPARPYVRVDERASPAVTRHRPARRSFNPRQRPTGSHYRPADREPRFRSQLRRRAAEVAPEVCDPAIGSGASSSRRAARGGAPDAGVDAWPETRPTIPPDAGRVPSRPGRWRSVVSWRRQEPARRRSRGAYRFGLHWRATMNSPAHETVATALSMAQIVPRIRTRRSRRPLLASSWAIT